jgi:hypothetical protein
MNRFTEIRADRLDVDDVLVGGGTVTTEPRLHPSGWVVVEIDWTTRRRFRPDQPVEIYLREVTV